MSSRSILPILLLAALAVGCGHPFYPATPKGFVDMGTIYRDGEYRAMTADGVVLGIRAYDNEPKGELAFWARALERRVRDMGGYALLEKRQAKNRGGLVGAQYRFGHDEGKTPHLYIITLFVTDERIYVLEAGGTKSEMDRQAAQIDWAIANFMHKS